MKKSFRLLCITLLAGNALQLPAQQVYSLDRCVEMALESNKDIQAAKHLQQKYEYEKKALYANYFPNVSLTASDAYSTLSGEQVLDIGMGGFAPSLDYKVKNIISGAVQVVQPLYMGGKITAGYNMGKIGAEMANLNQALSREKIIVSVYEGYHLLVKAKELRVVALKYDSLLVQLTKDVHSALEHGMVSRNEEMKVLVKKNEAELKIRQAENGIRLARMNLCQLIGLPLHTPIDIEPDKDSDSFAVIDPNANITDRTEYQLLDMKTKLAEQQVKLQKANLLPQLGLVAQGAMIDGLEFAGSKMFKFKPMFNAMVSLKVPIFHLNETTNKIRAAKEELNQQRMEQQSLCEKMDLELQQQVNEVDEANLEVALRKRNLEQCEENLRISRKSYDVGYETLSDLLTAQLLWQQAYAELVETKYQLKNKLIKWRKAAGKL